MSEVASSGPGFPEREKQAHFCLDGRHAIEERHLMISVLLVDNDAAYSAAAGRHLASKGMRTLREVSSVTALHRLHEADVMVVDVRLHPNEPQGAALARMVRLQRPDFPVILVTTSPSLVREAGPLNERVFLKPFDLSELTGLIARAVSQSGPTFQGGPVAA